MGSFGRLADRLGGLIDEALAGGLGSAAAVSVGEGGHAQLAFVRGAAWTGGPAITEATRFDVASLTKPMATAALAMVLVGEGRLALDATVRSLLPGAASTGTVAQLLGHAAGCAPHVEFWKRPLSVDHTAPHFGGAERERSLPLDQTAPPFGGASRERSLPLDHTAPPFGGASRERSLPLDHTAPPFGGASRERSLPLDHTAPPFGGASRERSLPLDHTAPPFGGASRERSLPLDHTAPPFGGASRERSLPLDHTAPPFGGASRERSLPLDRAGLVAQAAREPAGPPGVAAVYSDLGYIVLGAVLERAAGQPLEDAFAELVAGPLGLGARYAGDAGLPDAVATERDARGLVCGRVHDENAYFGGGVCGHAGLFAAIGDVAAFAAAIVALAGGAPRGRLRPDVVARFLSTASAPATSWRLGWDTPSHTAGVSHAGDRWPRTGAVGHLGFTGTSLWLDLPRGRWVALLTNRVHPTREGTADAIKALRRAVGDAVVDELGA